MENLNAEQIKKALECCLTTSEGDCSECGYRGKTRSCFLTCTNCLISDALALITLQEQRIKELTEKNAIQTIAAIELDKQVQRLTEENERLRAEIDNGAEVCSNCHTKYADKIEQAEADSVRKFAEKLKECLDDFYNSGEDALLDVPDLIDQIAKEMLEEKK